MKNVRAVFIGTIISIVITIVLLFCYSLLLANTNLNEQYMKITIIYQINI